MSDHVVDQYETLLRSIADVKKARLELERATREFQIEIAKFGARLQRMLDAPSMQAILKSLSEGEELS